jgi:hypothetical protein
MNIKNEKNTNNIARYYIIKKIKNLYQKILYKY